LGEIIQLLDQARRGDTAARESRLRNGCPEKRSRAAHPIVSWR